MTAIRLVLNLFIVLLITPSVFAAGRTGFPILMELMEPRTLALSGAVVSDYGHPDAVTINPACAAGSRGQFGTAFARHILDIWSGTLAASHPVNDRIIIGGQLSAFHYGEFNETRIGEGETGQTFTAAEYLFVGYAAGRITDRINWGGAAKYVWGTIDDKRASGIALDLGMTFDVQWEQVRLGLSARNIGSQLDGYGDDTDPLPTELIIGGSKQLRHLPLTLNLVGIISRSGEGEWEADFLPGSPGISFAASGEFKIQQEDAEYPLYMRIGYRSRGQDMQVGNSNDFLAGFSFGVGTDIHRLQIHYAFAPMGALGDVHRFGIVGIL
ncbi:MAG: PorV/PorQ family protein [Candidatus Electryoneaceae bacterium]|nr:PorV/PorQ family protein [Candidatus Electryoneaceae bacterium]